MFIFFVFYVINMTEYLNPTNIRMRSNDPRPHPGAYGSIEHIFFSNKNVEDLLKYGNQQVDRADIVDTTMVRFDINRLMRRTYDSFSGFEIPNLFAITADPKTTDLLWIRHGTPSGVIRPSLEKLNEATRQSIRQLVDRVAYRQEFYSEAAVATNNGTRPSSYRRAAPYPKHILSEGASGDGVLRVRRYSPYTRSGTA